MDPIQSADNQETVGSSTCVAHLRIKEKSVAIAKGQLHSTETSRERAFLVSVKSTATGPSDDWDRTSSLDELAMLADTAGAVVVGRTVQQVPRPNAAHYIGRGKLAEIVDERPSLGYSVVIFDDELTPSQQRNLEGILKVKVLDRTALILDIFAQQARTKEGALQVELAQLEYLMPRLRGQWSHLERLEGRIGTRGPGEAQLETDRRLLKRREGHLKKDLAKIRQQRSMYRRQRSRMGAPIVSLVGYTNAGKSTLMRAISGAEVHVENRLFVTLDPLTRRTRLPGGQPALFTDTVGFIQKLPHQLVAAFRATLEELTDAKLLIHVVDITHANAAEQSQAVEKTLGELGLSGRPRLTVLNKVDLIRTKEGRLITRPEELESLQGSLKEEYPGTYFISATNRWGVRKLLEEVETVLDIGASEVNEEPIPRRNRRIA